MPKCPNCGEEIDYLRNVKATLNTYRFYVDHENLGTYEGKHKYITVYNRNHYICPKCHKVLFSNEKDALFFLSGEEDEA